MFLLEWGERKRYLCVCRRLVYTSNLSQVKIIRSIEFPSLLGLKSILHFFPFCFCSVHSSSMAMYTLAATTNATSNATSTMKRTRTNGSLSATIFLSYTLLDGIYRWFDALNKFSIIFLMLKDREMCTENVC